MIYSSAQEFTATLPEKSRLLGLDAGETTIGLALTDENRLIASPLLTIERTKFAKDVEKLRNLVATHQIGGLVIGYPINMDGSLGPRTQSIRTLAANLEKALKLPMLLWDERMSTMAVERVMLEADLSRARRAQLVDKLAASYMLQGYLDSRIL